MNDQTARDVTDEDRRFARDWAAHIISAPFTSLPMEAAARVILNDIPAPAPKRPTLADMNPEERDACRWMQCDVEGEDARAVIINPYWEDGSARALWPGGIVEQFGWWRVTPRPDIPRMTWPGDKKPAPALPEGWRLADQRKYGRVIVTNPTPDRDGYVYFVVSTTGPIGNTWHFCTPGELTYLDQEAGQ